MFGTSLRCLFWGPLLLEEVEVIDSIFCFEDSTISAIFGCGCSLGIMNPFVVEHYYVFRILVVIVINCISLIISIYAVATFLLESVIAGVVLFGIA